MIKIAGRPTLLITGVTCVVTVELALLQADVMYL